MADLCRFRWDRNIFPDRIRFRRQKTIRTKKDPSPIVVLRNPSINSILSWFKEYPSPYDTGYVFPVLHKEILTENQIKNRYNDQLKKVNKNIQEIAADAGIKNPKEIGSYTARHSFSAIYYGKHKDIYALSKRLGHSTVSMTEKYLRSLGIEDLEASGDKISEALPLTIYEQGVMKPDRLEYLKKMYAILMAEFKDALSNDVSVKDDEPNESELILVAEIAIRYILSQGPSIGNVKRAIRAFSASL